MRRRRDGLVGHWTVRWGAVRDKTYRDYNSFNRLLRKFDVVGTQR